MSVIVRLRLIPQADVFLDLRHGPAQGWFLALAARQDPAWADALHQADARHPYALSPLYQADPASLADDDRIDSRRLADGLIRRGQTLALRLSLADDERARRLLAVWLYHRVEGAPAPAGKSEKKKKKRSDLTKKRAGLAGKEQHRHGIHSLCLGNSRRPASSFPGSGTRREKEIRGLAPPLRSRFRAKTGTAGWRTKNREKPGIIRVAEQNLLSCVS